METKLSNIALTPTGEVLLKALEIHARDMFAVQAMANVSKEAIQWEIDKDRLANPHNDNYKPKRRSETEIIRDLVWEAADFMMKGRYRL